MDYGPYHRYLTGLSRLDIEHECMRMELALRGIIKYCEPGPYEPWDQIIDLARMGLNET
jgi:hypothetical protein